MATTKFKPTIDMNMVLQYKEWCGFSGLYQRELGKLSAHLRADNSLLHSVRVANCAVALHFPLI